MVGSNLLNQVAANENIPGVHIGGKRTGEWMLPRQIIRSIEANTAVNTWRQLA